MKLPTDTFGNPANEPEVNADKVIDVVLWCDRYGKYSCEYSSLIRFNIGQYQISQALRWPRNKREEAVGACILNCLSAVTKLGVDPTLELPVMFSQIRYDWNPTEVLKVTTYLVQQLFYYSYAKKGSYRKDRVSIENIRSAVIKLICNVCTLTPPDKIAIGIESAAAILLAKAYHE